VRDVAGVLVEHRDRRDELPHQAQRGVHVQIEIRRRGHLENP
jgi:hypothetical protein